MSTFAPPLAIADQGGFWIGAERVPTPGGQVAARAMYVQYQIPAQLRCRWPLVMVHGGGGQGTDYLHTPDGRPGWATWFLRQGYAVYVVDRAGHGRSPFYPDTMGPMVPPASAEMVRSIFVNPDAATARWPGAGLHAQWPDASDDCVDQLLSGQGPMLADMAQSQALMRSGAAALLDRIGPAVILTHSMGGPFGWLAADERPEAVKAIVAIEPLSPPFGELMPGMGRLDWGLTAVPMTYEPAVSRSEDLRTAANPPPEPGAAPVTLQAEPARRWVRLAHTPTLVVTGEASMMALFDPGTVAFLRQAGVPVEHLKLQDHGQRGNGHLMMMERNSDAIAALVDGWLQRKLPGA